MSEALRKAAEQALASLEQLDGIDTETESVTIYVSDEIEALRAALAEPEQSEPSPFGWVKSSEMETSRRFGGSINLWREKFDCDVPVYLAAPPRREPQCKWPTCQTEEYQQKLSDDVASELIGTPRGEPQHAKHCASLTRLLLSDPPQKARCDCGAEGGKE